MPLDFILNGAPYEVAEGTLAITTAGPAPAPAPSPAPAPAPAPAPVFPALSSGLIPPMSANVMNGFVAYGSGEYSEAGVVGSFYKAFNQVEGSGWGNGWSSPARATAAAPQLVGVRSSAALTVSRCDIVIRTDSHELAPTTGAILGWDGSNWLTLCAFGGLSWANGERKPFTFAAQPGLIDLQVKCTDSGALCQIDAIQFWP